MPQPATRPTGMPTPTTPQSNPLAQLVQWKAGVIGALNVMSAILAARMILLVAVCGAIILAYLALQAADAYRLGALAIYTVAVVVPLVWLTSRK